MKLRIAILALMGLTNTIHAKPVQAINANLEKARFDQFFHRNLYGYGFYSDFKFHSTSGPLFNKYNGFTETAGVGVDSIRLVKDLYFGLSVNGIKSGVSSSSLISTSLVNTTQNLNSDGIYGHIIKRFGLVFIDLFGGYNSNTVRLKNNIVTSDNIAGSAKYKGNNEYIGIRTYLGYDLKRFILQGDLSFWYSRYFQNDYTIFYSTFQNPVLSLTTKQATFTENARLYYKLSDNVQPFIGVGLLQVASTKYSRPTLNAATLISTSANLPSLVLNKAGYFLTAGVNLKHNNLSIMPSYQYARRGNPYQANTYFVTAQYQFD